MEPQRRTQGRNPMRTLAGMSGLAGGLTVVIKGWGGRFGFLEIPEGKLIIRFLQQQFVLIERFAVCPSCGLSLLPDGRHLVEVSNMV